MFQAVDGKRGETGIQTCGLPISPDQELRSYAKEWEDDMLKTRSVLFVPIERAEESRRERVYISLGAVYQKKKKKNKKQKKQPKTQKNKTK